MVSTTKQHSIVHEHWHLRIRPHDNDTARSVGRWWRDEAHDLVVVATQKPAQRGTKHGRFMMPVSPPQRPANHGTGSVQPGISFIVLLTRALTGNAKFLQQA
ncbi:MAG TPA: hypothetical protein VGI81_03695 [Tepidisphaeraceae bacterium]|jgi:hypothetical protein